jgi:hypothetical protein
VPQPDQTPLLQNITTGSALFFCLTSQAMLSALRAACGRQSSTVLRSGSLQSKLLRPAFLSPSSVPSVALNARGWQRLSSSVAGLGQITLLDASLAPTAQSIDEDQSLSDSYNTHDSAAVHVDLASNTAVFGSDSRVKDLLTALQTQSDDEQDAQKHLVAQSVDGAAILSQNTRLRDLLRSTTAIGDDDVLFRVESIKGEDDAAAGAGDASALLVRRPPPETVISALLLPSRVQQRRDELYAKNDELVASIEALENTKVCCCCCCCCCCYCCCALVQSNTLRIQFR